MVDSTLSTPFRKKSEFKRDDDQLSELLFGDEDLWEDCDHENPRYHPNALKILDEAVFWDNGSPWSPHGTEIGYKVLEDFFEASKGSRRFNTECFLKERLEAIGSNSFQSGETTKRQDRKSYVSDPQIYWNVNEVIFAVVLADIKLKGKTSSSLAKTGLAACDRMMRPFVADSVQTGLWQFYVNVYEQVRTVFQRLA